MESLMPSIWWKKRANIKKKKISRLSENLREEYEEFPYSFLQLPQLLTLCCICSVIPCVCMHFFQNPLRWSGIHYAIYPLILQCTFPQNEDILIVNQSQFMKIREIMLIQFYCLFPTFHSYLASCLSSVL